MKKNIWTLIVEFLRGIGFSIPSPWQASAKKAGFENVNQGSLDKVFDYLRFCLEQICADKEMESLLKALDGDYVIPGPGGDPIRNPGVLPSGKNIHALDPQSKRECWNSCLFRRLWLYL